MSQTDQVIWGLFAVGLMWIFPWLPVLVLIVALLLSPLVLFIWFMAKLEGWRDRRKRERKGP
jgi:fumarate reductase subunit D